MKQGRKLTRSEKELLRKRHYNPEQYCYLGECIGEDHKPTSHFRIQDKVSGAIRVVSRF